MKHVTTFRNIYYSFIFNFSFSFSFNSRIGKRIIIIIRLKRIIIDCRLLVNLYELLKK